MDRTRRVRRQILKIAAGKIRAVDMQRVERVDPFPQRLRQAPVACRGIDEFRRASAILDFDRVERDGERKGFGLNDRSEWKASSLSPRKLSGPGTLVM